MFLIGGAQIPGSLGKCVGSKLKGNVTNTAGEFAPFIRPASANLFTYTITKFALNHKWQIPYSQIEPNIKVNLKFINIQQSTKTRFDIIGVENLYKFINIQQSTKTRSHAAAFAAEYKFINIQQSTKTIKGILNDFRRYKFINIQQSTKTILRSTADLLCISLSISNRVLKLDMVTEEGRTV